MHASDRRGTVKLEAIVVPAAAGHVGPLGCARVCAGVHASFDAVMVRRIGRGGRGCTVSSVYKYKYKYKIYL